MAGWPRRQNSLDKYPLTGDQIVAPILEAWDSIPESEKGKLIVLYEAAQ